MDISVVLATFNRDDILARTLASFEALETEGLQWQCFVVDNACRDETRRLVDGFTGSLPVRYLEELKAGKNNALLKAMPLVEGDLVIFTDDDVIADPGWLIRLWQGAQHLPQYDLFGGRILPMFPEGLSPEEGIDLDNGFTRSAYVIADWELPEGEIRPGRIWGPIWPCVNGCLTLAFNSIRTLDRPRAAITPWAVKPSSFFGFRSRLSERLHPVRSGLSPDPAESAVNRLAQGQGLSPG